MCSRISSHSGLRSLPSTSASERRPTGARVRVDDRELDLLLGRRRGRGTARTPRRRLRAMRASGRSTLLTTRITGRCASSALRKHEPRLRQRAFARVDEQQHAVDHREPALDLAAEVGVAGRVDDVERHVAVPHRGVLGEDRDALLALEVVRVHDALGDVLVGAERSRLPQQARRRAWSCRGRRGRRWRCCAGRRVRASRQATAAPRGSPVSGPADRPPRSRRPMRRDRRPGRGCTHEVDATSRIQRCALPRTAPRRTRCVVADVGPISGRAVTPAGRACRDRDRATRRTCARNRRSQSRRRRRPTPAR